MITLTLPEYIRHKRRTAGLSQVQLASILQMSQGAITQWENGRTTPTARNLKRLAEAINAPHSELIDLYFRHVDVRERIAA